MSETQLRQAKATDEDITVLIKHFEALEESDEDSIDPRNTDLLSRWRRVVFGCQMLIKNCCDPDKDYLDWKPELKNIIEERDRLGKLLNAVAGSDEKGKGIARLKERLTGLGKYDRINRPPIVCLCGSTRFMDYFHSAGWEFTLQGYIVLSVGVCKTSDHHAGEALGQEVADRLDELHLRKIDLADFVYVLNVGGYTGDSTRREIEYTRKIGKPIMFLEKCTEGEE